MIKQKTSRINSSQTKEYYVTTFNYENNLKQKNNHTDVLMGAHVWRIFLQLSYSTIMLFGVRFLHMHTCKAIFKHTSRVGGLSNIKLHTVLRP